MYSEYKNYDTKSQNHNQELFQQLSAVFHEGGMQFFADRMIYVTIYDIISQQRKWGSYRQRNRSSCRVQRRKVSNIFLFWTIFEEIGFPNGFSKKHVRREHNQI